MEHIGVLHTPVLLERCLDLLAGAFTSQNPVMIDCTLGMGGHSEGALERFENLTVIGIDRDPQAIALASERLKRFGSRFQAVHTTYDHIDEVAGLYGHGGYVDGVLMDLGVSSLQLDEVERGFSYAHDAALDMRMDQSSGVSAQQLLDTASVQELTRYLREYGEERFASKIASAIVRRREAGKPVTSTGELVQLVRDALPAAAKRTGGNPSKRTFQALRIAVNNELEVLSSAIVSAVDVLRVDGRIVVESYQSLEDRIVKQTLTKAASLAAPVDMPVVPDDALPVVELLTRGAERADAKELEHNSRSASVRLRAARKLRQVPISQHISLNTKQRKHR